MSESRTVVLVKVFFMIGVSTVENIVSRPFIRFNLCFLLFCKGLSSGQKRRQVKEGEKKTKKLLKKLFNGREMIFVQFFL